GGDRQQREQDEHEQVGAPERHRQELDGRQRGSQQHAPLAQLRVEASRARRRHALAVAIDDHHVLGSHLVAHAVILAPPPWVRGPIAVHGTLPVSCSEAACADSSDANRPNTAEPEPLTLAAAAPCARNRSRKAAMGGQRSSAAPPRSFSTSAASCSTPPLANGAATSDLTRSCAPAAGR